MSATFTCYIIGEGTLPLQCATTLWQQGCTILGIISDDRALQRHAVERGIPVMDLAGDYLAFLRQHPFDYLFSIVNPAILPPEVLTLPRKLAINYHDSLLPAYAGMHATAWALLHRQAIHGITWHVMTQQVDAGDILKQARIEIAENDTTFSLNLKCYAAALQTFAELVDDLLSGHWVARPQNLTERTFFGRYQRPVAAGLLDWHWPGAQIDALVRALHFGPYPNALGRPKALIGQQYVVITSLECTATSASAAPGTVVALNPEGVTIATATHDVVVRSWHTIEGQPLPLTAGISGFTLQPGDQLPVPDPALLQRITAIDQRIARHEAFWVQRLATLQPLTLPLLTMRSDTGLPTWPSPSGPHWQQRMLPPDLSAYLQATYPDQPGSTLLLSAFIIYLARLSGMSTFDLGMRVGAGSAGIAGLEGLFAGVVPLRIELDPAWPFRTAHYAVQEQVSLTRQHQTYVRDVVMRYPQLHPPDERRLARWDTVIVAQDDRWDNALLPPGTALIMVVSANTGHWVYDPQLLDDDSVAQLLQHFLTLLHGLSTQTERAWSLLPLVSAREQQQLLVEWNATAADYPHDRCVHQLIEAQVARTPSAVAVICEDQQLTYHELNQRADQLARRLQALHVGPEVLVGLAIERSLDLAVGLLAILKAGGAYVPLDTGYPQERLHLIIADTGLAIVLTQTRFRDRFAQEGVRTICVDTDTASDAPEPQPALGVQPDNLAYVIYTSGSTGKPNGVLVSHRALVNHNWAIARYCNIQPQDRILQFAAMSFDASAEEIFPCWINGATLVLRSEAILATFDALHAFIAHYALTILDLPTAYWHAWVAHLERTAMPVPDSLRLVIVGGEPALPARYRIWRQHVGANVRWINSYGPTETTIVATIDTPDDAPHAYAHLPAMPIGRPIANMQAYILDPYLNPMPPGIPGELYLSGVGLARGYLNRPELTAARFLPHPFDPTPGARLYKTGDRCRYTPDGVLHFLGRTDQQVKIRGFRIEVGEIETLLRQHPALSEAVVVAHTAMPGHQQLVAYIVPTQEIPPPDSADLRAWLQARLPDYMLPSVFVVLSALPLTPGGKPDRQALPVPNLDDLSPEQTYVAPRTTLETRLAAIWAAVLGRKRVGIHDNFFALGGDSLQSIQLMTRVAAAVQHPLGVKDLIDAPTIASLAEMLEQRSAHTSGMSDMQPQITRAPTRGTPTHTLQPAPTNVALPAHRRRRPLQSLRVLKKMTPVDAATLDYLPPPGISQAMLAQHAISHDDIIHTWYANRPFVSEYIETWLGRIAVITLPRFDYQLYQNQSDLVNLISEGLDMAAALKARVVSLAGLIPSATRYGLAITDALADRPDLPLISTGHASTTATVILAINRILAESRRHMAHEHVGFLGLGSIGGATLRLMLRCLPHPHTITLCDIYHKIEDLMRIKQELHTDFGFRGTVRISESSGTVPDALYAATLIIGATNVPDILDITRVQPGTLIVDDSAPHCFHPADAIRRLGTHRDILFTEGGVLQSPHAMNVTRCWRCPGDPVQSTAFTSLEITGCIFASLLAARFDQLQPTLGYVHVDDCLQHYTMLQQLGFRGTDLRCDDYVLPATLIQDFRERTGSSEA